MAGFLISLVATEMTATIAHNKVTVHNPKAGRSTSIVAPFSCSHQLVSDVAILEEALRDAFKGVTRSLAFTFPRVTLAIAGRKSHEIERRAIRDAALNAGASQINFGEVCDCEEDQSARDAYVKAKMADR